MNIIEASSSRRQKFKNERLEEMMEAIFKGTQKMNEGETKHMMLVIFMYIHGFKTSPVQLRRSQPTVFGLRLLNGMMMC